MAMLDLAPPAKFDADGRIRAVLSDPAASWWMKASLQSALSLDPVDAVNEAELLLDLLDARAAEILDDFSTDASQLN